MTDVSSFRGSPAANGEPGKATGLPAQDATGKDKLPHDPHATKSDAQQLYANIPDELKVVRQWCAWKYEQRDRRKPTKVPNVSVIDASTWVSFDEAVALSGYDGIGFVFSHDDPYAFIDLDDTKGDTEAYARQVRIADAFDSYSELSPSGRGLHIIIKASLQHGRRRDDVELYPHERFATMTGNVVRDRPIAERQHLASVLFGELGGAKASAAGIQADRGAAQDDAAVVAALCADAARAARYAGDTGGDHSAADMALCNALARISGNREQVERIWLASPLGQREKTQRRQDYRQRTIEAAFNEAALANVGNGFTVNGQTFFAPATPAIVEPQVIDVGTWHGVRPPVRAHVVAGWIDAGQVTYLTGKGASGKSLVCQLLATAVALGVPFLGQTTVKGVALYVTCEDGADELHRRQVPICTGLRVPLSALARQLGVVSLAGALGNELATFDRAGVMQPAAAFHWLERTVTTMGAKLVVLDNVAHLFPGDENNRHQVAAFVNLLNGLAAETGAAIALIGHPNKAGDGYSGSTAWENQVRTRLFLNIPQNPDASIPDMDARVIMRAKANYGRAGDALNFRWHHGTFVCEEDLPSDVNAAIAANVQADRDEGLFLTCLSERNRQLRAVSERVSRTYAPTVFAEMAESQRIGKRRLEGAMERLFRRGVIERGFLWRDTAEGKDRFGLRETTANAPANDPLTTSANAGELFPPTTANTHPISKDILGAATEQPPANDDDGGAT